MESFRFFLFLLAVLTSAACMVLLFRGYAKSRVRLLLWSALCFIFLSLNNALLFIDTIVFPTVVDLRVLRLAAALAGIACLLYAFIWEAE
ncbi:MAG TPA: DUF5985 family protein [Gammaproteobacteria bacterium]|nr:DUF5985 family protein [Gammaproteobacteria bacterium]